MEEEGMRFSRFAKVLAVIAATLGLGFALGCGEQVDERAAADAKAGANDAREAAKTLEQNAERSERVMGQTYDDARKDGTGAAAAAGDAYDAVLDEPLEHGSEAQKVKEAEKQAEMD
jgi:hypothetical protein